MHIRISSIVLAIVFATVFSPVMAQKKGASVAIQTGIVTQAQRVNLDSAAPGGAVVGGIAGYASARGKSSSKKARNAIIGSALGGTVAAAAQGSTAGMAYTVDLGPSGHIQVVTDQTEIRIGDCVSVERAGSGAVNIRRASAALCHADDTGLPEDIVSEMTQDAEACLAAREQLLNAEDDAAIDRAAMKVNILCND